MSERIDKVIQRLQLDIDTVEPHIQQCFLVRLIRLFSSSDFIYSSVSSARSFQNRCPLGGNVCMIILSTNLGNFQLVKLWCEIKGKSWRKSKLDNLDNAS